jgi:release factor glutamine methyltransferase
MKPNVSQKQDLTKSDPSAKTLLKKIQNHIKDLSESPYLDALVLLSHITKLSKSQLIADPSLTLTKEQNLHLNTYLEELKAGTPLPYVLGEWEFFNHTFKLSPDVLIPRPETEGLVELAIEWLGKNPDKNTCLEIGTGSGCIAVSLAKSVQDLKVIATDISSKALKIARRNALKHDVKDRIIFQERDLLKGFNKKVDLIIANLPYIPTAKLETLAVYLSEPTIALDGGTDGLHYIKEVLKNAGKLLKSGGVILLELDEDCSSAALSLAKDVFSGITLKLHQDLAGQDRYLFVQT